MKTVKIKVAPVNRTEEKAKIYRGELTWLWNKCREYALRNHCLEWYKWAAKRGVDLDRCILTPLEFSHRSSWNFARCRIATGGDYFKSDKSAPLIHYRIKKNGKWEKRTRHGYKRFEGHKPWLPIHPAEHCYPTSKGKELKRSVSLDSKTLLNHMREQEGLPLLTIHSDFVGGLIKDFDAAWKAYLDPNLPTRKQPKFKDDRALVSTLSNSQNPPKINGTFDCAGLKFQPIDKTWATRLGNLVPRSYKISLKPSGWYICISAATPGESQRPTLTSRRNKLASTIKKAVGKDKEAQKQALTDSPDYQLLIAELEGLEAKISQENIDLSSCDKKTGLTAGIDPGVKAIVATDHGALFNPNYARQRVDVHIAQLQNRLDVMRDRNDKKQSASWKAGKRPFTKNEAKLQRQISRLHERAANSGNMFNHKLSVRLARTYDAIGWEATQLGNMSKAVSPKLSEDGSMWEQNNAKAKTGLNRSLRSTCMGDLRAKTAGRMKTVGKAVVDSVAQNSSQRCHCCGEKGKRPEQAIFQCLNPSCGLHLVIQQADVNAAKNHKKEAL